MSILKHFDKNNLHHAYLVEGEKEIILPDLITYIEELGIKTTANPDFCHLDVDHFKKKEALDLRSMGNQKAFSLTKKIFILSVNRFNIDSQGILLKMFEEPIEDTHFFVITPNVDSLLKTFVSRFYLIKTKSNSEELLKKAELFISMSLKDRLEFIKTNLIKSEKKDEEVENNNYDEDTQNLFLAKDSNQSRALKFLDTLEEISHQKIFAKLNKKDLKNINFFNQIFQARESLRQPGSSAKTLLESVAISMPNY
ncbi:MAG: hypothetical protein ABH951_00375 [Patescibacteria group bacterium]